jgi:hypothetical protein
MALFPVESVVYSETGFSHRHHERLQRDPEKLARGMV